MARPKRTKPPPPPPPPQATASPSLGEALLLATVCMVGLPVEVQVRDGSAYEGIFHTACVDGGYGVVLKKARKTVNGMGDANFPLGSFVDTLVVLPDDLIQLIAKDFSLPSKDVYRTPACDMMATSTSVKPQSSHMKDPKTSKAENVAPLKQVKCSMPGLETDIAIGKKAPTAIVGSKDGNVTSSVSSTKTGIPSKTIVKESKLNPRAKLFSPSFASSRPVLAAAPSVNSNYISNSVSGVPTGVPVFETNFARGGSSLSSKAAHYNNLPPANYGISPQYIQSTVGHNVARLDPTRIGTPYYPMQVGPTYISPSPQPVTGGKFGPLVYVHPVPQDAMHGAPAAISQGWSLPVSLNSYQASFQKFQGTAPFYVAPPVMATGNLPLVVPSPTPLVQPFPAVHPIMVPSASSMVPGKYM